MSERKHKITQIYRRYVSLTVRPGSVEDALLLTLLGQRTFLTSVAHVSPFTDVWNRRADVCTASYFVLDVSPETWLSKGNLCERKYATCSLAQKLSTLPNKSGGIESSWAKPHNVTMWLP